MPQYISDEISKFKAQPIYRNNITRCCRGHRAWSEPANADQIRYYGPGRAENFVHEQLITEKKKDRAGPGRGGT